MSAALPVAALARSAAALLLGLAIGFAGARGRASGVAASPEAEAPRVATVRGSGYVRAGGGPAGRATQTPAPEALAASGATSTAAAGTESDAAVRLVTRVILEARAFAKANAATATSTAASTAPASGEVAIRGHVLTPRGAPVAGARVVARPLDPEAADPRAERPRGFGLVDQFPDRRDAVGAQAPTPVEEAERALVNAAALLVEGDAEGTVAFTDAAGAYALAGLAPGPHALEASREGYSVARVPGDAELSRPPAEQPTWDTLDVGAAGALADFVARPLRRVRFEPDAPAGVDVSWGVLVIMDPAYWFHEGLPQIVLLEPGLRVARLGASGRTTAGGRVVPIAGVSEAFVVEAGPGTQTVVLRARPRRVLTGRVTSDAPEIDVPGSYQVALRPAAVTSSGVDSTGTKNLDWIEVGAKDGGFTFTDVTPGAYDVLARRERTPEESPGPPARVVVPETGDPPEVTVSLPAAGAVKRVTVSVVDLPERPSEFRYVGLLRRTGPGADGRPSETENIGAEAPPPPGSPFDAPHHIAVREVDLSDPEGRPARIVAYARIGDRGSIEAPVPEGDDVHVTLRWPGDARLEVRVDAGGRDPKAGVISVELTEDRDRGTRLDKREVDASGAATFACVAAGAYRLRVQVIPAGAYDGPWLIESRLELAPGDNSASVTLPEAHPVVLEGAPEDMLYVYPIAGPRTRDDESSLRVGASGQAILRELLPGRYVAWSRAAREDEDPTRPSPPAAMTFEVPAPEVVLPFAPADTGGWGACVRYNCGCRYWIGLQDGDVIVAADGRPLENAARPFPPAARGAPPQPDPVRLEVVRDGRAREVLAPLAKLREMSASGDFRPVPRP